jgi:hypothetical protein
MSSSDAQKAWKRRNYLDKREYFLARDNERYYRFRNILQEEKKKPCADCGKEFHFAAMDFDHREDEVKIREVSDLKNFSSEKKLREEISKCDVVCSNCHRVRSYDRQMKKINGKSDNGSLRALEA